MSEEETRPTEAESTDAPAAPEGAEPETPPVDEPATSSAESAAPEPTSAPEPEKQPEPQPAKPDKKQQKKAKKEKKRKEKAARPRGSGCLPGLVALAFAIATAVLYFEWTSTKLDLAVSENRGRTAAISVLSQVGVELTDAKKHLADRDFGDAVKSLQQAASLLNAAKVTCADEAALQILERADPALKQAIEAASSVSRETPKLVDVVVDQVLGCQKALALACVSDWKEMYLTRRYKRVKRQLEDALTVFQASSQATGGEENETLLDDLVRGVEVTQDKLGEASEKALKEMNKLQKKLESSVSGVPEK